HVELASLSPAQIQAAWDEAEQLDRRFQPLSPQQHDELLNAPGVREQIRRFSIIQALSTPVTQALAKLLGSLAPGQWTALFSEQTLAFATEPQPGELPLPVE